MPGVADLRFSWPHLWTRSASRLYRKKESREKFCYKGGWAYFNLGLITLLLLVISVFVCLFPRYYPIRTSLPLYNYKLEKGLKLEKWTHTLLTLLLLVRMRSQVITMTVALSESAFSIKSASDKSVTIFFFFSLSSSLSVRRKARTVPP